MAMKVVDRTLQYAMERHLAERAAAKAEYTPERIKEIHEQTNRNIRLMNAGAMCSTDNIYFQK